MSLLPLNRISERGIYAASTSKVLATLKRPKCRAPAQGRKARQNVGEFSPSASEIKTTGVGLSSYELLNPVISRVGHAKVPV